MAIINEGKNVITCPGIILWDGIISPDVSKIDGSVSHNLTIAIPAIAPEKAEIEQLANTALAEGPLKGVLPKDGKWPIKEIDLANFGDSASLLAGRVAVTARTRNGVPPIYDVNGQELQAMQYGKMIYPGAIVKLLIHTYSYKTEGNRGVSAGLDGIQIVDATAPKLDVGGSMSASQVGAAFAGVAAPAPMAASTVPAAPHPGFVENAGNPAPPPSAAPQHVMLPAANGATYDQLIAAGWTDALLIQHGMMQG